MRRRKLKDLMRNGKKGRGDGGGGDGGGGGGGGPKVPLVYSSPYHPFSFATAVASISRRRMILPFLHLTQMRGRHF